MEQGDQKGPEGRQDLCPHSPHLAGVLSEVLALRWRAIRRFLKEGHPREKVAYWTGMKSLVVPGWEEG